MAKHLIFSILIAIFVSIGIEENAEFSQKTKTFYDVNIFNFRWQENTQIPH